MDGERTFRRFALALPGAVEGSHMDTVDFRVNNRIFATLAFAAKGLGTLKLTPEQQAECLADGNDHFQAVPGSWGRMGMTLISLNAPEDVLRGSLRTAHRNVAEKAAARRKRSPQA